MADRTLNSITSLLLLFCFAMLSHGCLPSAVSDFDWYKCINSDQIPDPTVATGTKTYLFPKTSRLWGQDNPDYPGNKYYSWPAKIHVCWEDSAFLKSEYAKSRVTVQSAIEETWNQALDIPGLPEEQRIGFVGWDKCGYLNDGYDRKAVHLAIADESMAPHSRDLGTDNAGPPAGVTMNFDFTRWVPGCASSEARKQECIHLIAVHEFGHVLGLAHEHQRPDTPSAQCTDAPAGGDGDLLIGSWDLDSVMNYCNPHWANDGKLSQGDVYGIQRAYYPAYFSSSCDLPVSPVARVVTKEYNISKTASVYERREKTLQAPGSSRAQSANKATAGAAK